MALSNIEGHQTLASLSETALKESLFSKGLLLCLSSTSWSRFGGVAKGTGELGMRRFERDLLNGLKEAYYGSEFCNLVAMVCFDNYGTEKTSKRGGK